VNKLMAAGGVLLAVATCVVLLGCGDGEKGKQTTTSQSSAPGTQVAAKTTAGRAQTLCPVMGEAINRTLFVDHQSKRVYFCCGMCPPKFKADPEKYLTAMAKEGIVLEKSPEGSK